MNPAHPAVVERLRVLVVDPHEADLLLDRWLLRFAAVADRELRRSVLRILLDESDDGSLLGVLHRLQGRAANGDSACRALAAELALSPSVLQELPYERTSELYAAARAAGQAQLALRFLGTRGEEDASEPRNPHLDLSAGERRAAARGNDRLLLDRLLHDRDPRVVATLLDNPRIIERDVVRIAAMRPTRAEILAAIAGHRRWGQRYRVRKALALNPATPVGLARPLLPTLLRQDLAEIVGSHVLSEVLRDEVRALLERG